VQRGVDRLVYGEARDPYAVISRLGERLEETMADLQRSRERLVLAREEERRRLRRDLHDGLGAQLAALNVQAGVLRTLIQRDPAAADAAAVELRAELRASIANIRRLVYDLRPRALDELGLLAALRESATQYAAGGPAISVEAPENLPPLPAAVEVAVYRIVQEALANVVRHAHATRCMVQLGLDGGLDLTVADDGTGLSPNGSAGVGLITMRERAAELGGTCVVRPGPTGGTEVRVYLPLPSAPAPRGGERAGG
jgi:signal transduction histidine kinase